MGIAWQVITIWVVAVVIPGYVLACGWLTILAATERDTDLLSFVLGGLLLWNVIVGASLLIGWGLLREWGWPPWLARAGGWLLLAAVALPFIQVVFVTGPLLLTALPVWLPRPRHA